MMSASNCGPDEIVRGRHLSPTFLGAFLGCRVSAAWTLLASRGSREPAVVEEDAQAELIKRKGIDHERACLRALEALHGPAFVVPGGPRLARLAVTRDAMAAGAPLITQAALGDDTWIGYADFLVRIDKPGGHWAWSYEPWDAKLARTARPDHVMQITLYGDFLAGAQGRVAEQGALMLGTGDPAVPYAVETFRLAEFRHYVRHAARRLELFAAEPPTDLPPEPCSHCGKCEWLQTCETHWEETDHLSRVAGITRSQRGRLVAAGVPTMASLGALRGRRVPGIGSEALRRLVQQARLQRRSAQSGRGVFEFLPPGLGIGFDRMPLPDPDDLFFDFEGDPMHPGGLEYLCGILWRARPGDTDGEAVPGHPTLRFLAIWAHDRSGERHAFDQLMTFLRRRLAAAPAAHLYHYAPYEKTAMRRLASMHAIHEAAFDDLLRENRMVDLYRVVREAVRIGEPSYSIKSIERFYMPPRTTEVASGGDSLVIYDRWQQGGDPADLDAIRDYNRDDCLSTLLLRDWLLEVAEREGLRRETKFVAPAAPAGTDDERARREQREREQADLEASLLDEKAPDSAARRLMADLAGFHRREQKPAWWAFFDRQERLVEELCDDDECLGGCVADGQDWIGRDKRSLTYRFCYPEQETKLREGSDVHLASTGERAGTIAALDEAAGMVVVKRSVNAGVLPRESSLIPGPPLNVDVLRMAVWSAAADMASGSRVYPHIGALLRRDPPILAGRAHGDPVIPAEERGDPKRLLAASIAAIRALDRSWLVIQGPPGTGKTYTTSHLVAALVAEGRTVGIASNSHKAIDNVLHAVETRLEEAGRPLARLGQKKDSGEGGFEGLGYVESVTSNRDIDPSLPILAGTAWLFAREELRQSRDVLFVDEAGQVSLGNIVAMATAARSVVLVGDHMQLAQPIQGAHPGESGASALDYLLQGEAVVVPEKGIFLSRTWRMHPDLCRFISDAVYDGQLNSVEACALQRLILRPDAHPTLKPMGLSFRPVEHIGCRQRSEEEADEIVRIHVDLLRQHVVRRDGRRKRLSINDILVVAPYNLQVNLLRSRLPDGARVGTVDKFQGQEADVVIVSMATSSAEDMPRDASFLLSRNRLNVAISRARCLAILVASPRLLDMVAGSVEEMRLANVFCWAKSYAEKPQAWMP